MRLRLEGEIDLATPRLDMTLARLGRDPGVAAVLVGSLGEGALLLAPLVGLPASAGFAATAINRVMGIVVLAPITVSVPTALWELAVILAWDAAASPP